MTADSPTGPRQCPPWCTGDGHLPDFPEDGYWRYGEPVTVTHGRSETIDPEPLEIRLQQRRIGAYTVRGCGVYRVVAAFCFSRSDWPAPGTTVVTATGE